MNKQLPPENHINQTTTHMLSLTYMTQAHKKENLTAALTSRASQDTLNVGVESINRGYCMSGVLQNLVSPQCDLLTSRVSPVGQSSVPPETSP